MKKTTVLVLCILLTVFAFTSCSNDTRVPENEDGNTTEPEVNINEIVGTWVHEESMTLNFDSNGTLSVKYSGSDREDIFKYEFEDNKVYLSTEYDALTDLKYTLSEDYKTLYITSLRNNDTYDNNTPYQAEGEVNGIFGEWIEHSNTQGMYYSYEISPNQIIHSNVYNDLLIYKNIYNYSTIEDGIIKLEYVEGRRLFAIYDPETKTLTNPDEGYVFIKK